MILKMKKVSWLVSHTCDPDTDSAAQLKHYADSMKVDASRWIFLTGRKDSCTLPREIVI
jgi:protein SCO1/2